MPTDTAELREHVYDGGAVTMSEAMRGALGMPTSMSCSSRGGSAAASSMKDILTATDTSRLLHNIVDAIAPWQLATRSSMVPGVHTCLLAGV